jgi:hypothetical protein
MRLFEVGTDFRVLLNKDWILTIPQFKKLLHRDKGSDGDYDGRKKLRTLREFTFIYHNVDPRSPLENMEDMERREKALQYAELQECDIDDKVMEAQDEYEFLLEQSCASLPLLRAAKGTNIKLIQYFNAIDFNEKDVRGQLVHSPMQHIKNISMLKSLHENTVAFEAIVLNELKEQKGTRGKTELGDKEQGGSKRKFVEGSAPKPQIDLVKDKSEAERLNSIAPDFYQFSSMAEKLDEDE